MSLEDIEKIVFGIPKLFNSLDELLVKVDIADAVE